MILHDGLLLLGGVVVLYLYDSALLLYHNEVVVIGGRRGCRVSGGSSFEFSGRRVFLPLPLCPHQPLFRLNWPERGVFEGDVPPLRYRRTRLALAALAPWMLLLLILFLAGLPYALFVSREVTTLLVWIVAVYAVIIAILAKVYVSRKALNLSGRAIASLALDSLLCAPFALNLVRKIGLQQRFDGDLRTVAATMLSPLALQDLTGILRERIAISLGFVEPQSAESRALDDYLHYFEGLRK